jgi:hypothetical protein
MTFAERQLTHYPGERRRGFPRASPRKAEVFRAKTPSREAEAVKILTTKYTKRTKRTKGEDGGISL